MESLIFLERLDLDSNFLMKQRKKVTTQMKLRTNFIYKKKTAITSIVLSIGRNQPKPLLFVYQNKILQKLNAKL